MKAVSDDNDTSEIQELPAAPSEARATNFAINTIISTAASALMHPLPEQ